MRVWLKKFRELKGWTQEKTANECGISRQYYNFIEAGERNVPVTTAKKIAAALGFDWQRFYEDTAE